MLVNLGVALDMAPAQIEQADGLADRLEVCTSLAVQAEAAGFDSLWLGESYPTSGPSFHLPDPLLVLAALAKETTMVLGTGVLLLLAWEARRLAVESSHVDQVSQGRLVLGVGAGPAALARRFGVGVPTGVHMDTTVATLREIWTSTAADEGTWPPPWQERGPKILVGGGVAAAVERAARLGDGFYLSTTHSREFSATHVAAYLKACADLGRSPGPVAMNRLALVAESDEVARRDAETYLAPVLDRYQQMGTLRSPKDGAGAGSRTEQFCLVGSPESVQEQIASYVEMGVTSLNLRVAPASVPVHVAERTLNLIGPTFRTGPSTHHSSNVQLLNGRNVRP